jgi:SagB-type dehydrogenase family enzyme
MIYLNPHCLFLKTSEAEQLNFRVTGEAASQALETRGKNLVEFAAFIRGGKPDAECVQFMVTRWHCSEDHAVQILDLLKRSEVVTAEQRPVSRWLEFGWYEPFVYKNAARAERFAEYSNAGEPAEMRENKLKEYEKAEPPPEVSKEFAPDRIVLPYDSKMRISLGNLLRERRTHRTFTGAPFSQKILGTILHAGFIPLQENRRLIEKDPSDLTAYIKYSDFSPFETFCVVHRVAGIAPGIYRYHAADNSLSLGREGDFESLVVAGIWGQPMALKAGVSIFITAIFERYQWRYRYPRAYMNLLVNLGELCQNLILAAEAAGAGSCMTPALRDELLCHELGLNPAEEEPLYYLGLGVKNVR